MSVSDDFLAYVLDQLAGLGQVRSRRMFGGVGLYADDVFFGLIDNDVLYLKVDDSNRAEYVARGCAPFRPFPDQPTYSMSYFQAPVDVLEEPEELVRWARKAAAAQGASAARRLTAPRTGRARKGVAVRGPARNARGK